MEIRDDADTALTGTRQENGAVKITGARTDLRSKAEREKLRRIRQAHKAYGRGQKIDVKGVRDKKLRRNLQNLEGKYEQATIKAKDAEILLENASGFLEPEGELERTYKVSQDDIVQDVAIETAQKKFDLKLDALGPYICEYTRNGRELLLAGRKGHIATFDWREGKLGCERQLGETVRDVRWLYNNQFFAAAQKNHVYIYDRNGVEIQCLQKHREVAHLEFLPYHFLLATLVSPAKGHLETAELVLMSIRTWVADLSTTMSQPARLWLRYPQNSGPLSL
jgi:U3 small nucleolar RNA-associated protein 7